MSSTVASQTTFSITKQGTPQHYRLTKAIMGNAFAGLLLKWVTSALVIAAAICGMIGVNAHQVSIPGVVLAVFALIVGILARRARLRSKHAIAAFQALPLPKQ